MKKIWLTLAIFLVAVLLLSGCTQTKPNSDSNNNIPSPPALPDDGQTGNTSTNNSDGVPQPPALPD